MASRFTPSDPVFHLSPKGAELSYDIKDIKKPYRQLRYFPEAADTVFYLKDIVIAAEREESSIGRKLRQFPGI